MQQVKSNQISNVKEMKPGSAKILELTVDLSADDVIFIMHYKWL